MIRLVLFRSVQHIHEWQTAEYRPDMFQRISDEDGQGSHLLYYSCLWLAPSVPFIIT